MGALEGGANMIPGKEITITVNITKGDQLQSAISDALTAAGVVSPCVIFTQKAKSTWAMTEFVTATIKNNNVIGSAYRYNGTDIAGQSTSSAYDFICTAGTKFYVIEVAL